MRRCSLFFGTSVVLPFGLIYYGNPSGERSRVLCAGFQSLFEIAYNKNKENSMARSYSSAIVAMIVSVSFTYSETMADTPFDDGQTHNVNYPIYDRILVDYEMPGAKTTVNWLAGADNGNNRFDCYEDSIVNVSGGIIGNELRSFNNSQVDISSGSTKTIRSLGESQVNISGGTISGPLLPEDNSYIAMSGGMIDSVYAVHDSRIDVAGGAIENDIFASYNSRITISGGQIGSGGRFISTYSATITIEGLNFAVDTVPTGSCILTNPLGGSHWDYSRNVSGTLANGESFARLCNIGFSGRIELIEVPEPCTLSLLILGGLAILRKRRR